MMPTLIFSPKPKAAALPFYLNAEYLVAQLDADNRLETAIEEKTLALIYKMIMTFSFPMNSNPINQKIIQASLSPEEKKELYHNEYAFLTKKVKSISESLVLIPVPKTFYQFFYMQTFLRENTHPEQYPPTPILFHFNPDIHSDYSQYCQDYIHNTEAIRSQRKLQDDAESLFGSWRKINAPLVKFLRPHLNQSHHLTFEAIMQASHLLIAGFSNKIIQPNSVMPRFCRGLTAQFIRFPDELMAYTLYAIEEEYKKMTQGGHYLLFRGGKVDLDEKQGNPAQIIPSFSYSDGLFAGTIGDAYDGNSISYILDKKRPMQIIQVAKSSCLAGDGYIFVPAVPSLARISGRGEFHHGRSMVPADHFKHFDGVPGIEPIRIPKNISHIQFLVHPRIPQKNYAQMCNKYLKEYGYEMPDTTNALKPLREPLRAKL